MNDPALYAEMLHLSDEHPYHAVFIIKYAGAFFIRIPDIEVVGMIYYLLGNGKPEIGALSVLALNS